MAVINPASKEITYNLYTLTNIEAAVSEIERVCLEEAVEGGIAQTICIELNNIRRHLLLKDGVLRHHKFS